LKIRDSISSSGRLVYGVSNPQGVMLLEFNLSKVERIRISPSGEIEKQIPGV
jgi:hypothetical protein